MIGEKLSRSKTSLLANGPQIAVATIFAVLAQGIFTLVFATKWGSIILGDELIFAIQIEKVNPANAAFSNQFYTWLYSLWNGFFGDVVFSATLLNGFFAIGTNLIILFIALRFMRPWPAAFASCAGSVSTLWIYSAEVLPESIYYFLVVLAIGIFLNLYARNFQGHSGTALFAIVFALATMTKPHAWALLAAVVIAALSIKTDGSRPWKAISKLVLWALTARVLIGLAVGGLGSLNFLGGYGFVVFPDLIFSPASPKIDLLGLPGAEVAFVGSLGAAIFPYLTAYVVMFGFLWWGGLPTDKFGSIFFRSARSYSIVLTVGALLFHAYISAAGDDHSGRILARYFEFLFLLSLVGIFYFLSNRSDLSRIRVAAIATLQLAGISLLLRFGVVSQMASDTNVLNYLAGYGTWFAAWIALTAVIVVLPIKLSQRATDFLLLAFLAYWVLFQSLAWSNFNSGREAYDLYVSDVRVAEEACGDGGNDNILFIADKTFRASKAQLDLGYLGASYGFLPETSGLSAGFELPPQFDCAFFIGEFAFDPDLNPFILLPGFAAIKPGDQFAPASRSESLEYQVSQSQLLTSWGSWVQGEDLEIMFSEPLNSGDKLSISIGVGSGATNSEILVEVGAELLPLDLGAVGSLKFLNLEIGEDGIESVKVSVSKIAEEARVKTGSGAAVSVPQWLELNHTIALGTVVIDRWDSQD
jgi:hypothetical protein